MAYTTYTSTVFPKLEHVGLQPSYCLQMATYWQVKWILCRLESRLSAFLYRYIPSSEKNSKFFWLPSVCTEILCTDTKHADARANTTLKAGNILQWFFCLYLYFCIWNHKKSFFKGYTQLFPHFSSTCGLLCNTSMKQGSKSVFQIEDFLIIISSLSLTSGHYVKHYINHSLIAHRLLEPQNTTAAAISTFLCIRGVF